MTRLPYLLTWITVLFIEYALMMKILSDMPIQSIMEAQMRGDQRAINQIVLTQTFQISPSVCIISCIINIVIILATLLRIRNADLSLWTFLLMFVPIVNIIFLFYLFIKK